MKNSQASIVIWVIAGLIVFWIFASLIGFIVTGTIKGAGIGAAIAIGVTILIGWRG